MKLQTRHLTNKMKTKLYQWRHLKAKGELPNSIMETFQKEQLDHLLASNQEKAEQICHKVCQFIITNKRLPFLKSKDPEERKFAAWLDRQRQAKINHNDTVHYPSLRKIAVSYKLSSIFKISYKRKKRKVK